MKKRTIVGIMSAAVLLAACQPATEKKAEQKAETTMATKKVVSLEKGVWDDKLYARLEQVIQKNANGNAYAVFDWDNTTIINDIGEATFTYQIENLVFKMTPEELNTAIRKDLPSDNFKEDWNNKAGEAVNIEKIATDIVADYQELYNSYKGFKGTEELETVKQTDAYKDFSAKLRYLYEAVGDSFSSDISYPWVTYLYTGMTSEEVQALAEKSIDHALKEELAYVTWESPATRLGAAGQLSVTFKSGVRSVKEMQNLYKTLQENGIDVYICSASYIDVIIPYATNAKYGYNIKKDNVTAMRLTKDAAGKIQTQLDPEYAQTQGAGKTKTIKKLMAAKHGDKDPVIIAGDSNGDVAMLEDFKGLEVGVIFNRLKSTEKGIGKLSKTAVDTYDNNPLYFIQGRDENKGVLVHGRETTLLGKDEAKLLKESH